jgi:hypothetical protein
VAQSKFKKIHTSLKRLGLFRSVLPGLVQSIDAGVIRSLISKVYALTSYTIVTCHDSIQYHPEFETALNAAIIKTYDNFPADPLKDLYFTPSTRNVLNPETLTNKLAEVKKNCGTLCKTEVKVSIQGMYPLEK